MIYTKDLTRSKLLNLIEKYTGKDIKEILQVKMHKQVLPSKAKYDKEFLIRTVPGLLTHPLRIWIISGLTAECMPDGYITINNLDYYPGFHRVSSWPYFRSKLRWELVHMIRELQKISVQSRNIEDMDFEHLLKVAKQMKFRFSRFSENPDLAYQGGAFSYVPVEHFSPKDPNSRFDEQDPTVRFHLHSRKIDGYTDGTRKCMHLYDSLCYYINEYFVHETGKGVSKNVYTPITDRTVSNVMNDIVKQYKKKYRKEKQNGRKE